MGWQPMLPGRALVGLLGASPVSSPPNHTRLTKERGTIYSPKFALLALSEDVPVYE
jgi:hypothetical protein